MARWSRNQRPARVDRSCAVLAALTLLIATAVACSGDDSGPPTLTWYANPDNGGQKDLAAKCTEAAEGRYRIEVADLPSDADGQREQLVRRLAANDSSIDLMSLDPVFVPEFAEAGFLRPFTDDEAAEVTEGVLDGPVQTVEWNDEIVAAPFWANTQLLWYRESVAEQAGVDPTSEDFTWDDLLTAAEDTDTTVAVTGGRYEGYMVLINALVMSAGGQVLEDPEAGKDTTPSLDSDAGRQAAEIIRTLARNVASPSLPTAIEEDARAAFQADDGGFMINWPYIYGAARTAVEDGSFSQQDFDDIAWARFPRVGAEDESKPALGGIDLGIGAFGKHPDEAVDAVRCITSVESQTEYMLAEGNSGARGEVYDDPEVQEAFPMADLIRDSIDTAGPRPRSAYYTDVSAATVRVFHPPEDVDPESTPADADQLIVNVLQDKQLL